MQDPTPKSFTIPSRKRRGHPLRDTFLVLLCLGLVALFFGTQTRFRFDSRSTSSRQRLERKLVFDGELGPKNLGLPASALDPLYALLDGLSGLDRARIHIERQDRYRELKDDTELRYWFVLTLDGGRTIRSVVARTQRKGLVRALTRRMADDLARYRDAVRESGQERVDSFTNTM